jgi:2-desacetyl-2-hydroxyethyl bacteriochlorophyllide A dehydrogenase
MKAVVLEMPGTLRHVDLPEPGPPGPGEALLAIRRVGVCGTDLHAFHGRQPFFSYPRILGHELAAEVLAVGEGVSGVAVGDACAVRPYIDCGTCDACRRGRPNCCTTLAVLGAHIDGGMRERLVVPARLLHPSRTLTLDQLALVETLSIGGHAVSRAAPEPGERCLVLGGGPIGLAATAFLRAAGAHPLVADVSADRRAFAGSWAGVETLDPTSGGPGAVRERLGGELPALVIDATGSATSMMAAFDLVAHGGRLVFVGLFQGDVTFHDPDFHRRETTLLASRNATVADFARTVALLESGTLDVGPWVTARVPLAAVPGELPRWAAGTAGMIKGLVEVSPS